MARAKKAGKTVAKATGRVPGKPRRTAKPGAAKAATERRWLVWTLGLVLGVLALRLAINAAQLVPVHFDEAQYWAYGQEFAWGHFSKPPLVGWVIRLTTDVFGQSLFGLRLGAPLSHALVALGVYAIGARAFGGETGFWAAAGYTAAPGVTVSAMIMSTDPVMMVAWTGALYAMIRAREGGLVWWGVLGACIGLGMLAKYTMLAFAAGALGYGIFSTDTRNWRGLVVAGGVALVVMAPNLFWNAAHHFVTVTHVAEDAAPGGGIGNIGKGFEFLGAQLGVIGPVWFALMIVALWHWRSWRGDAIMRLLAWQTFALLIAIAVLGFTTRAHPNWAAPAYVAGTLLAARIAVLRGWHRALMAQLAIGAAIAPAFYALTLAYATGAETLPRGPDPFKKMRLSEPYCGAALGAMAEEGVEVLLGASRRRLSECMFLGGLGWDGIAVWNPDLLPDNHHELVATLRPGDDRPMILLAESRQEARTIAARFRVAEEIETVRIRTHADREAVIVLWLVEGFTDYGIEYE